MKNKDSSQTDAVVAYAATRNIYKYLPTAINSVFQNTPNSIVYVFAEDDTVECLKDKRIRIVNYTKWIDNYISKDSPSRNAGRFTVATWVRLFIADFIPYNRVLYLDYDTVVDHDISNLFKMDMRGKMVAGCEDSLSGTKYANNITKGTYINAGVLLMDLRLMRDTCFSTQIKQHTNRYFDYYDQDCLNLFLDGDILVLLDSYNYRYNSKRAVPCSKYIYHGGWMPKPWDSDTPENIQALYSKYCVTSL